MNRLRLTVFILALTVFAAVFLVPMFFGTEAPTDESPEPNGSDGGDGGDTTDGGEDPSTNDTPEQPPAAVNMVEEGSSVEVELTRLGNIESVSVQCGDSTTTGDISVVGETYTCEDLSPGDEVIAYAINGQQTPVELESLYVGGIDDPEVERFDLIVEVEDENGNSMDDASVSVGGPATISQGESGDTFTVRNGETYTVAVSADGYESTSIEVTVDDSQLFRTVTLTPVSSSEPEPEPEPEQPEIEATFVSEHQHDNTLVVELDSKNNADYALVYCDENDSSPSGRLDYVGDTYECTNLDDEQRLRFTAVLDGREETIRVTVYEAEFGPDTE